ncbi:MAG TPA: hypothetical protein VHM19_02915, partial [Polyangiales bacterium]|nr:hypothetical protein [Polyangiales bacterium]
ALAGCRSALAAVREVTQSMDREASPLAEKALLDARDALHALLATEKNRELRAATGACVQLQAAIENALRIAEKASEHGYALGTTSASAHEHLHAIADAALGAIIESVSRGVAPSLEEAQAREIELNAVENETRRKLFEVADPNPDELPALLWSSELCAAYELVGNQLYRVASALGSSEL